MFGETSSPDNPEFKKFKEEWDSLSKSVGNYEVLRITDRSLKTRRDQIVVFLEDVLTVSGSSLPRDDYRELAEVTVILLGHTPPRGVHWLKLGAFHHVRWMNTIMYCAKMYAFSSKLKYSGQKK